SKKLKQKCFDGWSDTLSQMVLDIDQALKHTYERLQLEGVIEIQNDEWKRTLGPVPLRTLSIDNLLSKNMRILIGDTLKMNIATLETFLKDFNCSCLSGKKKIKSFIM